MYVRIVVITFGLFAVFAGLWLMWPSPINPAYWDEPEVPAMTGRLAPNTALLDTNYTVIGPNGAARSLAVGENDVVYYGNTSGEIMRRRPDDDEAVEGILTDFGDVPVIGLAWIDDDTLGATTPDGLFAIEIDNGVAQRVSAGVPGYPFGYANDLAVTEGGEIYFTDSSTLLGRGVNDRDQVLDMLENRPHGALYVWNPRTRQTHLAADRLYYPNGVAIASDQRSVFIAETFRYRVLRHWTSGPRAGETEVFADNLPGLPDSLISDGLGRLFVAMPARRSRMMRAIHRHPWLARIVARLPARLRPAGGKPLPFIAILDEADGAVISTLHDPEDRLCQVSAMAFSRDNDLWFGSTNCGYLANLPQAAVHAGIHSVGQ